MTTRVGIIGCGNIGSELAYALDAQQVKNATLIAVFDIASGRAQSLSAKLHGAPRACSNFEEFISQKYDIVVEAASQEAARKFAKSVLDAGCKLVIMSAGALADKGLLASLQTSGGKIYVPTGAIAGIDAIRSVKHLLDSVTLTTTKSPTALAGAPFFESSNILLKEVKEKTMIYEGPAAEAVKYFPANVNVAAVLSLAGIGFDKTTVRIIADPESDKNQHEITATGSFGKFHFVVSNVPSPGNPKTSYLAVLSAIECLRSLCGEDMKIGS
jgi:aspartate dehydrogenase